VFENVVRMLRVGGQVVHMASFEVDHGFYGLSPSLFFDFYGANGFDEFQCLIPQFDYSEIINKFRDPVPFVEYFYGMPLTGMLDPARQTAIFFVAKKVADTPAINIPVQGLYAQRLDQSPDSTVPTKVPSLYQSIVPRPLQPLLAPVRPYASATVRAARRFMRKPRLYRALPRI
jgi:hypothetical protein